MRPLLTLILLAGLAAAAPADASSRLVARGKVEHVKLRATVSGTRAVPSDVVVEHWTSRSASHMVRRDARTGKLEIESYAGPHGLRIYDARRNTLWVDPTPVRPIRQALDDEVRVLRDQVAQGRYTVEPDRTLQDGRVVSVLRSRGNLVLLSRDTGWLVRRETTGLDGRFRQVEDVLLAEVLPLDARTAPKVRPTPRPRARRVKALAPSAVSR